MRAPLVCPDCTAAIGKPIRHAARRRCSTVQAQRRYSASSKGRAANAAAVAAFRSRTCSRCLHEWRYHAGTANGCDAPAPDDNRRCGCSKERPDAAS